MSPYSEGYADGQDGVDWSDSYFGDEWAEYTGGREQAKEDLLEDEEAYDHYLDRFGEAGAL